MTHAKHEAPRAVVPVSFIGSLQVFYLYVFQDGLNFNIWMKMVFKGIFQGNWRAKDLSLHFDKKKITAVKGSNYNDSVKFKFSNKIKKKENSCADSKLRYYTLE